MRAWRPYANRNKVHTKHIVRINFLKIARTNENVVLKTLSYMLLSCCSLNALYIYTRVHHLAPYTRVPFQHKDNLTCIGNPIVEIRRSQDRLISTMRFPILVRQYTETVPGAHLTYDISLTILIQWMASKFNSWPAGHCKFLYIPRQHSCQDTHNFAMIFYENLPYSKIFPLN